MSVVPENLPRLRRGTGYAPHVGGCLVQVANWLCDHTLWTDQLAHVDLLLADYGIRVNDRCNDADRRELALAAVRIAGTGGVLTDEQSNELRAWAAELFLLPGVVAGLYVSGCGVTYVTRPTWNGGLSSAEMVERYFLLVEMFEELSGHQPRVVPEEEWAELAMAMSTPPPPPAVTIDEVHQFQNTVAGMGSAVAEVSNTFQKITAGMLDGNIYINTSPILDDEARVAAVEPALTHGGQGISYTSHVYLDSGEEWTASYTGA